ncbi:GNAT family N-acetyltransferase [Nocardia sp. NPDC058058]|uniref:GNAT family N-acetyltransferase n=1 Tax=Nocardia sp. NPDC058058 TaxID=3346317 RepID=UPI0036DDD8B1
MSPETLNFQRCSALEARRIRGTVEQTYRGSYVEAIAADEPFSAPDEFMHRFIAYTAPSSGFEMVVARVGDQPVGQAWGWPLGTETRWWANLELDEGNYDGFTVEDGTRTFALSEIMVRTEFTGRGIAHALHDELLSTRPEQRATLLVEPDNIRAYTAYRKWGWERVGVLRPSWPNAPQFDALIRTLRIP